MGAKDDEMFIILCVACGDEFADTKQLSAHIDEEHRNSDSNGYGLGQLLDPIPDIFNFIFHSMHES